MDEYWKDKNIYEKIAHVGTKLFKEGIRESGNASFQSERTQKWVEVKFVPRKEYLQRALFEAEKVGLWWYSTHDVEKGEYVTIAVNLNKPEEKVEIRSRAPVPQGTSTSRMMQNAGVIQSYAVRRNEYALFNIIESNGLEVLSEEVKDDDDANSLAPITEKTKAELRQLLGQCDSNDDRVKSIADKDLLKMNEGWAVFAVKTLKNILKEEEDVPYNNPKPTVVESMATPEQMDKLRKLYKECKSKKLRADIAAEMKTKGAILTCERCEELIQEMQKS